MQQRNEYSQFVAKKLTAVPPVGLSVDPKDYGMFPHQRDLVRFALRRGRSAILADTGLGKTRMQIAWADTVQRETGRDVLILAPLAVAQQTVEEAQSVGVSISHAHDDAEIVPGINITNYDRLHKFDTERFGAVVLDESSCIKHHNSKTLQHLLDAFSRTPYRLCATATPAPNDWTELGTHAEFLGIRSRTEMLAEFFVHDGGDTAVWRLKGHARHLFWKWVSSWGVMLRSPADLGYDDSAYRLPSLNVHQHTVESTRDQEATGQLFALEAQTLMDRRKARRESLSERVRAVVLHVKNENTKLAENANGVFSYGLEKGICGSSEAEGSKRASMHELQSSAGEIQGRHEPFILSNRIPYEKWIVWCDLNDEQDALEKEFRDAGISCVSIRGSTDLDARVRLEREWRLGNTQVLISKSSIFGWGLNWQHCARMAFVGVTDSWEAYYQAVRRCWRFGQKRPVDVHIFSSEQEGAVVANLKRKEEDAKKMSDALAAEVIDSVRSELIGSTRETNNYDANKRVIVPSFLKAA